MSDDEIHGTYFAMNDAFCSRMRKAIAAGPKAWNTEPQIRPNRALAAKLLVGRYELLVDANQKRRLRSCDC